MATDDGEVVISDSGTMFVGKDGVSLATAIIIRGGLRLYAKHRIRPARNWSPTAMLSKASAITGQSYKRGQYEKAVDDMTQWIEAMKAAIPITVKE